MNKRLISTLLFFSFILNSLPLTTYANKVEKKNEKVLIKEMQKVPRVDGKGTQTKSKYKIITLEEYKNLMKKYHKYTLSEYNSKRKYEYFRKVKNNPYYELRNKKTIYVEQYVELSNEAQQDSSLILLKIDLGNELNSIYQFTKRILVPNNVGISYELYKDEETNELFAIAILSVPKATKMKVSVIKEEEVSIPHFYDINLLKVNINSIPINNNPILQRYISYEPSIESDDTRIINKSNEIAGVYNNIYDKASNIFDFVSTYMEYDLNSPYANTGALNALLYGRGVCEDYAKLMIALLRVQRVPSKFIVGFRTPLDETSSNFRLDETFRYYHGWVEFFVPNVGWLPADPTTWYYLNGQKMPGRDEFVQDFPSFSHIITDYDDVNVVDVGLPKGYTQNDIEILEGLIWNSIVTDNVDLSKLTEIGTEKDNNEGNDIINENEENLNIIDLLNTFNVIDFNLQINKLYIKIDNAKNNFSAIRLELIDVETKELYASNYKTPNNANIVEFYIDNLLPQKSYILKLTGIYSDNNIEKAGLIVNEDIAKEYYNLMKPNLVNINVGVNNLNVTIQKTNTDVSVNKYKIKLINESTNKVELERNIDLNVSLFECFDDKELYPYNLSVNKLVANTNYQLLITPYYFDIEGETLSYSFTTKPNELNISTMNLTNVRVSEVTYDKAKIQFTSSYPLSKIKYDVYVNDKMYKTFTQNYEVRDITIRNIDYAINLNNLPQGSYVKVVIYPQNDKYTAKVTTVTFKTKEKPRDKRKMQVRNYKTVVNGNKVIITFISPYPISKVRVDIYANNKYYRTNTYNLPATNKQSNVTYAITVNNLPRKSNITFVLYPQNELYTGLPIKIFVKTK